MTRRAMAATARFLATVLACALVVAGGSPAQAASTGTIAGRVQTAEGTGLAGVEVSSDGFTAHATSDADGRYSLPDLAPGTYDLLLTLGDNAALEPGITVAAEAATEVVTTVDWDVVFGEVLTVRAASRYEQRIVEAPAAVTSLTAEEIERRAGHGQLPRLLAGAASVELPQSGLFDYTVNTRGFNGSTNRRVATLVDGRDPSQPVFSGAQEWAALSFGLDDLATVEMVHGPGAALYGAGAYNGVLDLRTRPASESLGGRAQLTFGELGTARAEARLAGGNDRTGFVRASGGYQQSRDFLRSRTQGGEYGGGTLPPEVIAPPQDEVSLWAAALRYERQLTPALSLVAEGGSGSLEGTAVVTGVGRLQREAVDRPWARLDLGAPHWNLLGAYSGRVSDGEVSLATGNPIFLDSYRAAVEGQANASFHEGRGRAIGGASWTRLRVDSADRQGRQTIFAAPVASEHEAVFGQVEYDLGSRLLAVGSLRWDDSDLHDPHWSPRGALVLALGPYQSLRLTYSEAFLSPTLSEKHVEVAVAPPLDLSPIEDALAPLLGGVPLGLEAVPLLAVGNPDLDTEEVATWELGYTGALGNHTWLTANVYRSELSNFTTNLIPVLGTSLGQLVYPPLWQPPAELTPQAAAAVRAALAAALPPTFLVAAAADGSPYVPLISFGSFGEVDTTGVELNLVTAFGHWRVEGGLSWFDYEVATAAAENPVAPNRADVQTALGVGWVGERLDAHAGWRWSDGFDYLSGIFAGPVPAYSVVDLAATWRFDQHWSAGLTVANALDDEHYETFGGDLLGRRALAHATIAW
jgi:outer membrane receptor protein involved in Fe transport